MNDSHPIFTKFEPWEGNVPACYTPTPYGSFVRRSFQANPDYESEHYFKAQMKKDEEYFEYIDLLESIDSAQESFTMVELGAGYGHLHRRDRAAQEHRQHDLVSSETGLRRAALGPGFGAGGRRQQRQQQTAPCRCGS